MRGDCLHYAGGAHVLLHYVTHRAGRKLLALADPGGKEGFSGVGVGGEAAFGEEDEALDETPEVGRDGDVSYLVALAEDAQEDLVSRLEEVSYLDADDLRFPETAGGHDGEHDVVAVVGGAGRREHARELVLRQHVVGRVLPDARALGEKP